MKKQPSEELTRTLRDCARSALEADGYEVAKAPGVGRSAIWTIRKNGKEQLAAVRTTQDRWIAFPRMSPGWTTLDDVEVIVVAAVDDRSYPRAVEVYLFPADEVHRRFEAAYEARIKAGGKVRENFGMWVGLDRGAQETPNTTGSGIVDDFAPMATLPLPGSRMAAASPPAPDRETVADVLAEARQRISMITGIPEQNVKLDLHIETAT